jgi:hypothetical protein
LTSNTILTTVLPFYWHNTHLIGLWLFIKVVQVKSETLLIIEKLHYHITWKLTLLFTKNIYLSTTFFQKMRWQLSYFVIVKISFCYSWQSSDILLHCCTVVTVPVAGADPDRCQRCECISQNWEIMLLEIIYRHIMLSSILSQALSNRISLNLSSYQTEIFA